MNTEDKMLIAVLFLIAICLGMIAYKQSNLEGRITQLEEHHE